MPNTISSEVERMFINQLSTWELAHDNFHALSNVKTKTFKFDGFSVTTMFNPGRIISSKAKTNPQDIASRPCFLCPDNRPQEQVSLSVKNFEILINPYPIFRRHLTIVLKQHKQQQFIPYIDDFLYFAYHLSSYSLFFNGAKCGASAPDHMHFQACNANSLPVISDFRNFETSGRNRHLTTGMAGKVSVMRDYLRCVYCIESKSKSYVCGAFSELMTEFKTHATDESMINTVCCHTDDTWQLFIFPRKAFRPLQYSAEEGKRLLISPAAVEMSGILITPEEEHFNRLTHDDIVSIYSQISI